MMILLFPVLCIQTYQNIVITIEIKLNSNEYESH